MGTVRCGPLWTRVLNSENGAYLTEFNPGALKPHLQEEVRFHCLRSHSCDFTSRFQGKEERLWKWTNELVGEHFE